MKILAVALIYLVAIIIIVGLPLFFYALWPRVIVFLISAIWFLVIGAACKSIEKQIDSILE